ncbi:hypothetical protein ES708_18635 [subsurface metagenome]
MPRQVTVVMAYPGLWSRINEDGEMTGSGTLEDPYIIYDVDDLQAMEDHLDAYYELANDIDASETSTWNEGKGFLPIGQAGNFTGQLDGKEYKVTALHINRPGSEVGLFNVIGSAGVVKNIGLEDCDIVGVGACLAYENYGEIDSCYVTGTVADPAASLLAGLVGVNDGAITKCYSEADIDAQGGDAGGLVSENYGTITDCYARGSVWAYGYAGGLVMYHRGTITNSYSTGAVYGDSGAGGLVQNGYPEDTINSFWDTETSGQLESEGGTGKTTAQMKTESTFTDAGWNFAAIWTICSGVNNDYPCLLGVTPSCVLAPVIVTPTVTTDPATEIQKAFATLNGTLAGDGGEACDCGFEWGETIVYGNTTPTQSRTTGQTFSQTIGGLLPGSTYHFRAFATNSAGTSYGADRTFTTLVAVPTVTTNPATDILQTFATPNGTLDDDGGEACGCGFEWGETEAYEHGATSPQSKTTGEDFSRAISGLSPGTTYHFRAFATNSAGTGYGADRTFTTLPVAYKGNINIDQLIYQHAERMAR